MKTETVAITRSQIGHWASIVGGIGLLIGFIGLIWQNGITEIIAAAFGIGIFGLLVWIAMSPREFKAFINGRQARYSTTAVFGALLLVGIVVFTYVVLQRAVITLDMTQGQRYSISNETRAVLRRITQPIQITGFYSSRALQQREIDDPFFRAYEVETNGLVRRVYIDPNEQPALAQKFNVEFDSEVYISYLTSEGDVDFDTLARVPRSGTQERDLTEAISRLLISGSLTIYFNQGLGELDPLDNSSQGLSGINNGIRESGLITYPVSITELSQTASDIPPDASALILARPTTDFTDGEIAVIDRYLQRGGALFIMADVLFNQDSFMQQNGRFNQYLWDTFGIRALDAVIVDPSAYFETELNIISAAIFPENEIARRLDQNNAPTLFKIARALEASTNPVANTPNGRVIMSSPESYGETDLKSLGETNTFQFDSGQDIQGPLASVVWANNRQTGAKILLVGDSDFATNSLVGQEANKLGNSLLFTDGLSWLTGFGDQITFAPQAYGSGTPVIFISAQQLDLIAFITVILIPGIVLAAGIGLWLRRMQA